MSSAVRKTPKDKKAGVVDLFTAQKSAETIAKTHTTELVIALCGPIGSPLHDVATALESMLMDTFNYEKCTKVRLSKLIGDYAEKVGKTIPDKPGYEKIQAQIDVGNDLRAAYGAGVLAELAVNSIRLDREVHKNASGATAYAPRRVCHIIDSVKNQEELDLLRMVYREMLYVVGVFSPLDQREENLKRKGLDSAEVYELIDRDSGEESKTGQTVRDTFPQCDFFLRMDSGTDSQLSRRVARFLNLILGTKVITPTLNESAMYAAATAAANSACLSRQVGAAVTTSDGEVTGARWGQCLTHPANTSTYKWLPQATPGSIALTSARWISRCAPCLLPPRILQPPHPLACGLLEARRLRGCSGMAWSRPYRYAPAQRAVSPPSPLPLRRRFQRPLLPQLHHLPPRPPRRRPRRPGVPWCG